MLISLLFQLIAAIFVTRPPGIQAGQWSPHARDAVRTLERRHFGIPIPARPVSPAPTRRDWVRAPATVIPEVEGEWTCK